MQVAQAQPGAHDIFHQEDAAAHQIQLRTPPYPNSARAREGPVPRQIDTIGLDRQAYLAQRRDQHRSECFRAAPRPQHHERLPHHTVAKLSMFRRLPGDDSGELPDPAPNLLFGMEHPADLADETILSRGVLSTVAGDEPVIVPSVEQLDLDAGIELP